MKHPLFQNKISILLLGAFLLLQTNTKLLATNTSLNKDKKNALKRINALKVNQAPRIDGILDDLIWENAQTITGFTSFEPNPNTSPSQETEVKVAYDNLAIYFGAHLRDEVADSILKQVGLRDSFNNTNADYFGVFLDTYNDNQNAFGFIVSASDAQSDIKYSTTNEDLSWDAVWFSKARITDDGWVVEIKIPYSAIRFPEKISQNWGIGFMRQIRRNRERMMWNDYDPTQEGFVNQFGTLENLSGIEPPMRLSITPYLSTYYETYTDKNNPTNNYNNYDVRGGMDLKYGINESFTLDMALIPDFGQVRSDDQVLNLSPFEVRFDENRPFFMEGTELFSKANLFYSRRIGGQPINYWSAYDEVNDEAGEALVGNPSSAKLLNATKISGRTKGNVGLGFFNAVTGNTYATIENEAGEQRKVLTNPLSNYNIVVVDKALKNRSYISLINTNVMRQGSAYDANVTGTDFNLATKNNRFALSGTAALSQIIDSGENDMGYSYALKVGKVSGNFQYNVWHGIESDRYNPNDLGFLYNNNTITQGITLRYNIYEDFGAFNSLFSDFSLSHEMLYEPRAFSTMNFNGSGGLVMKSFFAFGAFLGGQLLEGRNYFEPRTEDLSQFSATAPYFYGGLWISSDYRQQFALDINVMYGQDRALFNERVYEVSVSPRIRPNDRTMIIARINYTTNLGQNGYVNNLDDGTIFYGNRNIQSVNNVVDASYNFNSRMAVSLRARHYWSKVVYNSFSELQNDGYLTNSTYTGNHNRSYNAFTANIAYTWMFSPGSQLSLVWKNDIYNAANAGTEWSDYLGIRPNNYFDNLNETFKSPQNNNLSLRLLYYIDYQMVTGRFSKKQSNS